MFLILTKLKDLPIEEVQLQSTGVSQETAFDWGGDGGYTRHQLVSGFVDMYQEMCGASTFYDGEHRKKQNETQNQNKQEKCGTPHTCASSVDMPNALSILPSFSSLNYLPLDYSGHYVNK